MKSVNPYLNFNGNAEEAFLFYRSVFGGELTDILRFKDTPDSQKLPAADQNKVAYAALPLAEGIVLMGSDAVESMGPAVKAGTNNYIHIDAESKEEADRLFNRLSAGGRVEIPLQDTFWGAYYGSFADRYGVQWMISFTYPQAEQA